MLLSAGLALTSVFLAPLHVFSVIVVGLMEYVKEVFYRSHLFVTAQRCSVMLPLHQVEYTKTIYSVIVSVQAIYVYLVFNRSSNNVAKAYCRIVQLLKFSSFHPVSKCLVLSSPLSL